MAKEIKFEDKMERLSKIVEELESNNSNIDDAIKLYEEGLKLTKELDNQLKSFQEKIDKVKKEKDE